MGLVPMTGPDRGADEQRLLHMVRGANLAHCQWSVPWMASAFLRKTRPGGRLEATFPTWAGGQMVQSTRASISANGTCHTSYMTLWSQDHVVIR